jgi:hypothetical protein
MPKPTVFRGSPCRAATAMIDPASDQHANQAADTVARFVFNTFLILPVNRLFCDTIR